MCFQGVPLLLSRANCYPTFLRIVLHVKAASGLPRLSELWPAVGKSVLPVNYFCSNKFSFVCKLNFV